MRILGQILLWAGFIGAALAGTQQRVFDILPEKEQEILSRLPDGPGEKLYLNSDELKKIAGDTPFNEMTIEQMSSAVDGILPVHQANKVIAEAEMKAAKEAKARMEESGGSAGAEEDAEEADSAEDTEEEKGPSPVSFADLVKSRTSLIENKWPTIPWMWYGLSMAVGLVGVFLLRSTAKSADQEQGKVDEQFVTLTTSLDRLQETVSTLAKELDKKKPAEVVHYIDDHCAEPFADFADSRNSLVQKFGLQPYADIMTQFASAERFMNRSWSAAADGYMNEVRDCVERANKHLEEAGVLIDKFNS